MSDFAGEQIITNNDLVPSADREGALLRFLTHVLPDQGLYAVAIFRPGAKGPWHYWAASLHELSKKILEEDARGNTVYHACASYQQQTNRKQANALGAKSFWLDIDAGDGKPYCNAFEAYQQVEVFCRTVGLPPPVYVGSGNGLHVYWPLKVMLDRSSWERYARGLKQLCVTHGLHAGPERTTDIASILRPPGTHHRKAEPKLVEVDELVGPYEIDQFDVLLNAHQSPKQIKAGNGLSVAAGLAATGEQRPAWSNHIAAQCAQVARLRDERGCIPEPSWYACLCLLAFCDDGNERGHEWSAGYEGYTFEETQARLDRARTLSGATTCEHFHSLDSAICEACPHWRKIKSPISLGRIQNAVASANDAEQSAFRELAALPAIEYDRKREKVAKELGIRVGTLDAEVDKLRPDQDTELRAGRALALPLPEPWPEPVNGAELLKALASAITRFVVIPWEGAVAVALWIMHAHALDASPISPRLAIKSPEKRCGKTTLLRVIRTLVPKPLSAANITAAAMFRTVEATRPTLLIDEADTFLSDNEELRGIINTGHGKEGQVVRLVAIGDDFEPRAFSTFCAVAIAAIGRLPGTVEDRSIAIPLRRKRADERVERFREDRPGELSVLARKAARWTEDHIEKLRTADPETPADLNDRGADNWRPLLAIADLAGPVWQDWARNAALSLSADATADQDSIRTLLLADIRTAFDNSRADRMSSDDIVAFLEKLDDRPWSEFNRGKAITKAGLARLLKPFRILSTTIRLDGNRTAKGYYLSAFEDAFTRYLPAQIVTTSQSP
jgi:Protein of unknown function (DUF3631)